MALRCRFEHMVVFLLENGADPSIGNAQVRYLDCDKYLSVGVSDIADDSRQSKIQAYGELFVASVALKYYCCTMQAIDGEELEVVTPEKLAKNLGLHAAHAAIVEAKVSFSFAAGLQFCFV